MSLNEHTVSDLIAEIKTRSLTLEDMDLIAALASSIYQKRRTLRIAAEREFNDHRLFKTLAPRFSSAEHLSEFCKHMLKEGWYTKEQLDDVQLKIYKR